jgi:hypothetical protein
LATVLVRRPARRSIRDGSTQAILAVRITDGTGSPACSRSSIATSQGQDTLSALVIMASQIKP